MSSNQHQQHDHSKPNPLLKEEIVSANITLGKSLTPFATVKKGFVRKTLAAAEQALVLVDQFVGFVINRNISKLNDVIVYARPPIIFGLYVIFIFVICGGYWAFFAPLDSAAHAVATVIANVDKQRIQHMHGGRVKKVFAKQGDVVNEGQVLIEIRSVDAKSSYEISLNNYLDILAQQNRLIAQRDQADQITFDEILIQNKKQSRVAKLLSVQNQIFREATQSYQNSVNIIRQSIKQCLQKQESLKSHKIYVQEHLKAISDQLRVSQELEKDGFVARSASEILAAEKAKAESEMARTIADYSISENEHLSLEMRIQEERNKRFQIILAELRDVQYKLSEAKERYTNCKEVFDAQLIVSPMRGIVNDLVRKSIIQPQSDVGGVTPIRSHLIVEGKIAPQLIDSVKVGQKCKVKFTAFKSRTSPVFNGIVTSISPNTIESIAANGYKEIAYGVILEMNEKELKDFMVPRGMKLVPGMQADVSIVTGSRSLFRYLLDPVLDHAFKAMKEK
jgi:HlyD family type I secretion membrane fusion protein